MLVHPDSAPDRPGLRVLVVDDDAEQADNEAVLLTCWGHAVVVAHDGAEALRKALIFRPDVVLLDIDMPILDGCALARELRRRDARRSPALIAVTGEADWASRRRALACGIDLYLVKPVEPALLRRLLAQFHEARTTEMGGRDLGLRNAKPPDQALRPRRRRAP